MLFWQNIFHYKNWKVPNHMSCYYRNILIYMSKQTFYRAFKNMFNYAYYLHFKFCFKICFKLYRYSLSSLRKLCAVLRFPILKFSTYTSIYFIHFILFFFQLLISNNRNRNYSLLSIYRERHRFWKCTLRLIKS